MAVANIPAVIENWCSLCSKQVGILKELPCCHSFCVQCLTRHEAQQKRDKSAPRSRTLTCPKCGVIIYLPEGGLEILPDKSDHNSTETETVLYCYDCKLVICQNCRDFGHFEHKCAIREDMRNSKMADNMAGAARYEEKKNKMVDNKPGAVGHEKDSKMADNKAGAVRRCEDRGHVENFGFDTLPAGRIQVGVDGKRSATPAASSSPLDLVAMRCLAAPPLLHSIDGLGEICGIAILHDNLYLLRTLLNQVHLEVYETKTFKQSGSNIPLPDIRLTKSLASCKTYSCLYFNDLQFKFIYRFKVTDKSILKWSTPGEPRGLSVTSKSTLLVTILKSASFIEYTTYGTTIRKIKLDSGRIKNPLHAIEVQSDNFAVCIDDEFFYNGAIMIVNNSGTVLHRYVNHVEPTVGQNLCVKPSCLATDSHGNILVTDLGVDKVLLLDSRLQFVSLLDLMCFAGRNRLRGPTHLCLETHPTPRLYVCGSKTFVIGLMN